MAKDEASPLTAAQREIMEIVWSSPETTVTEVWETLSRRRDLARNTVQTMMARLEDRGWLKHRAEGKTYYYSAKRPRSESLGNRVAQMVDRLFAGSPEELVTALLEHRGLTTEEAQRIQKMIEEAEAKKKRSSKKRGRK